MRRFHCTTIKQKAGSKSLQHYPPYSNMHEKQQAQRPKNGAPRIPLALQTVFLDGNRGIVVNTPPPDKSAMTTFFRWRWWGRSQANESGVIKKGKAQKVDSKLPAVDEHVMVSPRRKKKKVSKHRIM
jgi:hypothetical protein